VVTVGLTPSVPLVALLPLQLEAGVLAAVQAVTFVLLQVSVLEPPAGMLVGFAVKVSVGVGPVTEIRRLRLTDPLVPVQLSV
jgi:hypothetical protein